jgi:hypothetical protein
MPMNTESPPGAVARSRTSPSIRRGSIVAPGAVSMRREGIATAYPELLTCRSAELT